MERKMKECPYCGEQIPAEAKKCRYCGEWLEEPNGKAPISTPPAQPADGQKAEPAPAQPQQAPAAPPQAPMPPSEPTASPQTPAQPQPAPATPPQAPVPPSEPAEPEPDGPQLSDPVPEGFKETILRCFRKYIILEGRATRSEYWLFVLCFGIISIVLYIPLREHLTAQLIVNAVFGLIIGPAAIAAGTRRLHDVGKSGWWWFIGLVPLVGPFILIYQLARASEDGDNKYGTDPWENPAPEEQKHRPTKRDIIVTAVYVVLLLLTNIVMLNLKKQANNQRMKAAEEWEEMYGNDSTITNSGETNENLYAGEYAGKLINEAGTAELNATLDLKQSDETEQQYEGTFVVEEDETYCKGQYDNESGYLVLNGEDSAGGSYTLSLTSDGEGNLTGSFSALNYTLNVELSAK